MNDGLKSIPLKEAINNLNNSPNTISKSNKGDSSNKNSPTTTSESKGPDGRWLPGHSGNPGGRPKDAKSWSGVLRDAVEKQIKGDGRTLMEIAAENLAMKSLKNIEALKLIIERMEGKPRQALDIEQRSRDEVVEINAPENEEDDNG